MKYLTPHHTKRNIHKDQVHSNLRFVCTVHVHVAVSCTVGAKKVFPFHNRITALVIQNTELGSKCYGRTTNFSWMFLGSYYCSPLRLRAPFLLWIELHK